MATLELELPYCSDSDDTDGPPPPKRACIEPDQEADKAADEDTNLADKDDVFEFVWDTKNYFNYLRDLGRNLGRNPAG